MNKLNLGFEFGGRSTLVDTYLDVINSGVGASQIYVSDHRSTSTGFKFQDIYNTYSLLSEKKDIFRCIHSCMASNLAGSVSGKSDGKYSSKLSNSIRKLSNELELGCMISAPVVVHPGFQQDRLEGIRVISDSIQKALTQGGLMLDSFSKKTGLSLSELNSRKIIALEGCAGERNKIGSSFDELKEIISGIPEELRSQVKICMDTCHLFGSGQYNLGETKHIDTFFQDFNNTFGIDKLAVVHLNDSKGIFGSRIDRHAGIHDGYIFGQQHGEQTLSHILDICKNYGVPMVLETPNSGSDYNLIKRNAL